MIPKIPLLRPALALAALLPSLGACRPLSEEVRDPAIGRNPGFEEARNGLPVNWLVYSPRTVPDARFELLLDRDDPPEGEQALLFRVEACSPEGGWRSPGVAQEVPRGPGRRATFRFWVRYEDCDWEAACGAVSAKRGTYERLGPAGLAPGVWHEVVREVELPEDLERLRFELSVRSPGRLWLDDVRLEPVASGS